jgi:hypothetical protein
MKVFDITYFEGPTPQYITQSWVIEDIAAAGFTLVPLSADTDTNKAALRLLGQYGLRAVVADPRIYALYHEKNIAPVDTTVKEVVTDYGDFENIIGWDLCDEPSSIDFPILAALVNAFRRYSPEKETVINLFPNYATTDQLGNPDYVTHLEEYINTVRPHYLSYDHYHFLGRDNCQRIIADTANERERLIRFAAENTVNRGGFFENLRDIRRVADKYQLDAMLIVLLTEHGHYRNLTYWELLWEVNMCLVYGMRRLSYFTYWEPDDSASYWNWKNAMCDRKGKKERHYYDVQRINREVKPVGEYLFHQNCTAVFHIGEAEQGAEVFTAYGYVKGIKGKCGVVGFFDDGSIYLVNRDYQNTQNFQLLTDVPITVMRDGVFVDADSLEFALDPGGAVLLKGRYASSADCGRQPI